MASAGSGAFAALTELIGTNQRKGVPIVVFNPLSWTRAEVVSVPLSRLELKGGTPGVTNADGEPVASQVSGDRLLFLAGDVPGIGYRTFWVRKFAVTGAHAWVEVERRPDRYVMQNEAFRAEVDARTGDLRSVALQPDGPELLEASGGNILQLHEDLPEQWDAWNIGLTGKQWGIELPADVELVEQGLLRAVLRVKRKIGASVLTQDYVVTGGQAL